MTRAYNRTIYLFIVLFVLPVTVSAKEIKGIKLPSTITVADQTLTLNGAGIRTKFVFDIYVGALYLTQKTQSAQDIINSPHPKQVSMYFLYDEISKEKMVNGWNDGFEEVLDESALSLMRPRIETFNNAFGVTREGDVIHIRYVPDKGTEVIVNTETRATIPGTDFHQALMKIWLGPSPVDSGLKDGMLNVSE